MFLIFFPELDISVMVRADFVIRNGSSGMLKRFLNLLSGIVISNAI